MEQRALPLDFELTNCTHTKKFPWQYSRPQWHQLVRFASRLRLPLEVDKIHVCRPSTLELYLSYMICNGDVQFESQLDPVQGGQYVGVQLSSFLQAWRSFQHVCKAQEVVPQTDVVRDRWGERSEWGHLCALPKFALLCQPVILPKWKRVAVLLGEAASQGADSVTGDEHARGDLWRLWAPGLTDSQLHQARGTLVPMPLASVPDKPTQRLRGTHRLVRWQIQVRDYSPFPCRHCTCLTRS